MVMYETLEHGFANIVGYCIMVDVTAAVLGSWSDDLLRCLRARKDDGKAHSGP